MSPLVTSQAKSQGSDWSLHTGSMTGSLVAKSEADSLSQAGNIFCNNKH